MKKLNRKGFTLIELLAIIVILAIIMVVTIPTVLNSMDSAKEKQLQNAVDSVADWVQKQYDLVSMGLNSGLGGDVSKAYTDVVTGKLSSAITLVTSGTPAEGAPTVTESINFLEAAGIADADTNIASAKISYNSSKNRVCVELTAKDGGSFYVTGKSTKTSAGC